MGDRCSLQPLLGCGEKTHVHTSASPQAALTHCPIWVTRDQVPREYCCAPWECLSVRASLKPYRDRDTELSWLREEACLARLPLWSMSSTDCSEEEPNLRSRIRVCGNLHIFSCQSSVGFYLHVSSSNSISAASCPKTQHQPQMLLRAAPHPEPPTPLMATSKDSPQNLLMSFL